MEKHDLVTTILDFTFITDSATRLKVIQDPIFKEQTTIDKLREIIDYKDLGDRLYLIEHLELLIDYQRKGVSALEFFISYNEIEHSFTEFAFGFDNFKKRKDYLLLRPVLLDPKSIKCINQIIENKKGMKDSIITAMRLYRNLLKACRIIGIENAFKEFDTPEEKYVDTINNLFKADNIYELIAASNSILESESIRNVFHYLQASYEENQRMRENIISLWGYILGVQSNQSNIWFWEDTNSILAVKEETSEELLRSAWKTGVRQDYLAGLIQYESNLQASLYHHLRCQSSGDRILSIIHKEKDLDLYEPDIVILSPDSTKVDFILELKCIPWNSLKFKDYQYDLSKLLELKKKVQLGDSKIKINPYFDPKLLDTNHEKSVFITKDTQFGFVAISRDYNIRGLVCQELSGKSNVTQNNFCVLWANSGEKEEIAFRMEPVLRKL